MNAYEAFKIKLYIIVILASAGIIWAIPKYIASKQKNIWHKYIISIALLTFPLWGIYFSIAVSNNLEKACFKQLSSLTLFIAFIIFLISGSPILITKTMKIVEKIIILVLYYLGAMFVAFFTAYVAGNIYMVHSSSCPL